MNTVKNAQETAGRLGMQIWLSILPHAENLKPRSERRAEDVPAAARLVEVTSTEQLRAGDLILTLDNNERHLDNNRIMAQWTVREAVEARESAVRRVVSVGNTVITIEALIHIPLGGWGSCDPDKIGEPASDGITERIDLSAARWTVARLGHRDAIGDDFRRHPDYVHWRHAYHSAEAQMEKSNQIHRARMTNRELRALLLAAVESFNAIVGEQLVSLQSFGLGPDEVGMIEFPIKWFAKDDRLVTYLAGLLATGKIKNVQYIEALGHLRTLGLYTAELPADVPTTTEQVQDFRL